MGLDMTDVVIMIPGVRLADIRRGSRLLEEDRALRRANDVVVEFMLAGPIAKPWGEGFEACSDLMSLDVNRNLWLSRVDPKRRRHAVGTYTHVLDQWGIVYDQPPAAVSCARTRGIRPCLAAPNLYSTATLEARPARRGADRDVRRIDPAHQLRDGLSCRISGLGVWILHCRRETASSQRALAALRSPAKSVERLRADFSGRARAGRRGGRPGSGNRQAVV
jgi:Tn3 transposase DDE domain